MTTIIDNADSVLLHASEEPFYVETRDETALFLAAYAERIPVLLKGPTGCGKTRFVEHMAWRLGQQAGRTDAPGAGLVTVTCHDDLTAGDLVGRFILHAGGTEWVDGPLTTAVRNGGLCYLDEVVEARRDTIVSIHALTDHRRLLPIEKLGVTLRAHDDFFLVVSYNPGYQATSKELKHSTRQRFIAIDFDYPTVDEETQIIAHEAGVGTDLAGALAKLASQLRNLDEIGFLEGPSTRLMIYAGRLIRRGIPEREACENAVVQAVTDDQVVQDGVREIVASVFA
ncbi:MAG TPA: CbbQ/NirQ/NorQ/GpvN family protein [Streptosporangiaceae bacterium]|jgi:nitric oxide reductase NorQ protein|nr:CbbQ/NirQ/NorQ/GpvN family protein [Streptosporangiaceae bacterium]